MYRGLLPSSGYWGTGGSGISGQGMSGGYMPGLGYPGDTARVAAGLPPISPTMLPRNTHLANPPAVAPSGNGWVPIIGSSFSDVGNQVARWDARNLGVDEANIARANAAEQNVNRWNANVADLRHQQESERYRRQLQADQFGRADQAEQRQQFEWGVGRADRIARDKLAATLEREGRAAHTAENATKQAANVQSAILEDKISQEDVWMFMPKTPQNVERVNRWFDQALKEKADLLNSETARIEAANLEGMIKAKRQLTPGASLTAEERSAASKHDPQTLELIRRRLGLTDPRLRYSWTDSKWTSQPAPAPAPFSGTPAAAYSNMGGGWTAPAAVVNTTANTSQWGNQGGGYFPPAAQAPAGSSELVSVINPSGKPVKIRRNQLTDALSRGYRLR